VAPKSEIDRALLQLESEMRRLEGEYSMFFAGRLPRPPWESRSRVDGMVKRLDRTHIQNTAERFRFNTLQMRYSSLCELWERALRAKEEGRPIPGRARAGGAPPGPPAQAKSPTAPAKSPTTPSKSPAARKRGDDLVHEASFRNPDSEVHKVKELYERVAEARRSTGESAVPFERFRELVQHQVAKLGKGGDVEFKVALKDGKVNLTSRAVKPTDE
jgi:hypothetical protein